jgi:hypothetical protein
MKKLYMIRLQNGNSVVLQAEDERQAIEIVGLDSDGRAVAEQMKANGREVDLAEVQLMLMESGCGQQNFTIRELSDFNCGFTLKDDGQFSAAINDDESLDEFYKDYPELEKAEKEVSAEIDRHGFVLGEHGRVVSPREIELTEAGVLKERTRLTAIL